MKPAEKAKTQKLLTKIKSESFDENDIDSLFMKLRAYSLGFPVFREIADFVAHNDQRDRGLANQSLETMYLRMKFFLEYNSPKKILDLSAPFPLWIKRLMILQVDKSDETTLLEKFNVSPQRLKIRIDKGFKDDKQTKMTIHNGKLSENTFNSIKYIMSFISGNATITQKQLINELVGVLNKNNITFNESNLRLLSDKITICILLLFHKSSFDIKGYKSGHCVITCDNEAISHNVKFVDLAGNEVKHHESFGNLKIGGTITLNNKGKDLSISHDILSTELDAELWCSDSLFHIEPFNTEVQHLYKRLKLDVDLTLNNEFRLTDWNA